jgi:hypothetical protein
MYKYVINIIIDLALTRNTAGQFAARQSGQWGFWSQDDQQMQRAVVRNILSSHNGIFLPICFPLQTISNYMLVCRVITSFQSEMNVNLSMNVYSEQ